MHMPEQLARIIFLALIFVAGFCLVKGRYHEKNTVTRVGLVVLIAAVGFGFVWAYVLQHGLPAWLTVAITLILGGLTGYLFDVERINGRLTHRKPKRRR
jgi:apolipoprotein N-acyltransferase